MDKRIEKLIDLSQKFADLITTKPIFVFAGFFALIAIILLTTTRAAGPFAGLEPELGAVTDPAIVQADTQASGGEYVEFGDAIAPPLECTQTVTSGANLNDLLSNANDGDVICLNNGDYGTLTIDAQRTGYATIKSVNQSQAVFSEIIFNNARYIRLVGLKVNTEIRNNRDDTSHIELIANDVTGIRADTSSGGAGVTDWLIAYNDVHDCDNMCIDINGGTTEGAYVPISNFVVRGNKIGPMGAGEDAIRMPNFNTVTIEDNEIFGVIEDGQHNDCLQTVWGGQNITYRRNYLHDNNCQSFFIKDGYVTGVTVEDNLSLRNREGVPQEVVAFIYQSKDVTISNNTWWDDGGFILRKGYYDARFTTGPVENYNITNNVFEYYAPYDEDANSGDRAGVFTDQNNVFHDYNLICAGWTWVPTFLGPHSIENCSPNFVNPTTNRADDLASGDYRLSGTVSGGGESYTPGITWELAGRKFGIEAYSP
ncbi:MAG: hypothetical protein R3313_02780 [Candidatus Saccharimonadales bacterium]|nr:hypothetical protein [Candidatus Saccharimonadales bacterium]